MCNYNNYIFVIIVIFGIISTEIVSAGRIYKNVKKNRDYDDDYYDYLDYDLSYDQRQNGTENYRLHIDGVVVALPAHGSGAGPSSDTVLSALDLLAGELLSSGYENDSEEDYDVSNDSQHSSTTSGTISLNFTTSAATLSSESENLAEELHDKKIAAKLDTSTTQKAQHQAPPMPIEGPMKKPQTGRHEGSKHHRSHLLSFIRPLLVKYRKSVN